MDYEFEIALIKREVAHLQEIKDLQKDRLNGIQSLAETILKATDANTAAIAELTENVTRLVSALQRDHPNGSK